MPQININVNNKEARLLNTGATSIVASNNDYVAYFSFTDTDFAQATEQWMIAVNLHDYTYYTVQIDASTHMAPLYSASDCEYLAIGVTANTVIQGQEATIRTTTAAVIPVRKSIADYTDIPMPQGSGLIDTQKLADAAVTSVKLANSAVTTNKIANGAVNSDKLANGAVGNSKLGADSVTNDKIADDAVQTENIKNKNVVFGKLSDGVQAMLNDIANKANIDGYYETLAVGFADNLTDRKGDGTEQKFIFRTTAGSANVSDDGTGIIKSVHGNTLIWNQIVYNGNFSDPEGYFYRWYRADSATIGRFAIEQSENGIHITETPIHDGTSTTYHHYIYPRQDITKYVQGHKYYISTEYKNLGDPIRAYISGTPVYNQNISTDEQWIKYSGLYISDSTTDARVFQVVRVDIGSSTPAPNIDVYVRNVMVIDLTEMFGAGNEPSTAEEFERYFDAAYYDYYPGSFINFNGTGIKTTGFNQWDEQWELDSNNRLCSKNYIPVFPNTDYCLEHEDHAATGADSASVRLKFYDKDKILIYDSITAIMNTTVNYRSFTTPENAAYMKFVMYEWYGNVYKNDICVNIRKNYQSQNSMDELSMVIGDITGSTISKTWNAQDQKYEYTYTLDHDNLFTDAYRPVHQILFSTPSISFAIHIPAHVYSKYLDSNWIKYAYCWQVSSDHINWSNVEEEKSSGFITNYSDENFDPQSDQTSWKHRVQSADAGKIYRCLIVKVNASGQIILGRGFISDYFEVLFNSPW